MFMQAGFALVETGLCRAKNAGHTMAMNFMIYGLGMLGYFICGFAFQFGGVGLVGVPNLGGPASSPSRRPAAMSARSLPA
jgi:Amt family ammonium transporter